MRKVPTHHGRPLYSRQTRGYAVDLANLTKLRLAALCDPRITTRQLGRIVAAEQSIKRVLDKYAKPKKTRK